MTKFFAIIVTIIILATGGGFYVYQSCQQGNCPLEKFFVNKGEPASPVFEDPTSKRSHVEVPTGTETATSAPKTSPVPVPQKVVTPGPLKIIKDAVAPSVARLTRSGVIDWTNRNRSVQGVASSLSENAVLDRAAEAKVDDMFAKQYFEHVSPSGVGVDKLAESVGYEYIVVGENLALGNFKDDETLVTAWMNSPGHRANILNARFQEIGVAVRRGTFEGREVWLAVQEFGRPLSSCPSVNPALKQAIENNKTQTESLKNSIEALKQELEAMEPKWGDAYNQKVDQYNSLVAPYNQLVEATRALVDNYNIQVRAFNECAGAV